MNRLFAALLLVGACAAAEIPGAVAIRNAKIVTVGGPVLAKGTVVIRNGLIEAVGDNVQAPADAAIVEGEGLTVYPGLVDGLSTWGMPGGGTPAAAGGGRGGGGGAPAAAPTGGAAAAPPARGPEDRPATTSWIKAADEILPTDRRITTARAAGFTTAVAFPTRGIFAGQGAIIDLGTGETAGDMVVSPSAGQYIALARGGGGFPSALMGTISYIRQIYLDAAHYALVKDAYAHDPRGMQRPAYDRALEGVLESKRILLPANRLVEIDRMLHFAAELKQPVILYGMQEGFRPEAVDLLKKAGVPALVSLKWPEAPRDPDPELVESLRTLQTRDQAASAPMMLKKAGVPFAFYSDGLDAARDLQRAVKKAIDAGLSREDAVRALTLSPAEIYGVADRLGSIEKGKIGNLVVTSGDIFDDRTKVMMVFVDGVKYIPPPETAPAGGRGAPATETPTPGGVQ
jgi:imidazolonepropionase-like amidohydrolase